MKTNTLGMRAEARIRKKERKKEREKERKKERKKENRSPKGNIWSAMPVALL